MNHPTQKFHNTTGLGIHRFAIASSAAALAFTLSLACPASAHAATLCVDQHSKPGCYSTITAAVTAAAPGDTINVGQGLYHEDVVLGESLSLVGEDSNSTVIDAAGLSNGIYIDGLDNPSLAQVTVSGFTIQHANFEGILVVDALDVTLYGNTVQQNDRSLQASIPACPGQPAFETAESADCGSGIHLIGVVSSTVSHNLVTQNAGGILISDEVNTSHDNYVTNNVVKNNPFSAGISLASHVAAATTGSSRQAFGIYNNTLSGNESTGNGGAGIGLFTPSPGTRTFANSIIGNRLIGNAQTGFTIHSLIFTSDSGSAPGNSDASRNIVSSNFISGNGADPAMPSAGPTGVSVLGIAPVIDLLLSSNTIQSETVGVAVNSASTLDMHLNNLAGTRYGVDNLNPGGLVNATMNWWGCSNGPGSWGCASFLGAKTVSYTPWLKAPTGSFPDNDCDDSHHGWGWLFSLLDHH